MTHPYVPFPVVVRSVRPVGSSFVRVTFTGDDLHRFADNGDDQRIKLLFPAPDGDRPLMRTYTARAVRPDLRELDVDLVRHGDGGPASRWAGTAAAGDPLVVVGPNAEHPGPTRAATWNPPAGRPFLVLGADETAAPAVAAILERLPADAHGVAVLEVPEAGDILDLTTPAGVEVRWHVRAGRPHGEALEAEVRAVAARAHVAAVEGPREPEPEDRPSEVLWDVPEEAAPPDARTYAWLAGEAACITRLRRYLVRDLGVDRRSVAFMGYWRAGVAEPQ